MFLKPTIVLSLKVCLSGSNPGYGNLLVMLWLSTMMFGLRIQASLWPVMGLAKVP
jgi:hypothetical protein